MNTAADWGFDPAPPPFETEEEGLDPQLIPIMVSATSKANPKNFFMAEDSQCESVLLVKCLGGSGMFASRSWKHTAGRNVA